MLETTDGNRLSKKKPYVRLNTTRLDSLKQDSAVDTGNLMPSHTVPMRTG